MTDPKYYRLKHSHQYPNEKITRVPRRHLLKMVSEGDPEADVARAELQRRGTRIENLEVSAHAVDQASKQLLRIWRKDRQRDEGLYTWLGRVAGAGLVDAAAHGRDPQRFDFQGITFVFDNDGVLPVLLTVYRAAKG